jgi:nicotinamide phosphoribosyltransferase
MNQNLLLMVDSYKVSISKQYPPATDHVYSYIEARGGAWSHAVMFGLQAFLRAYLSQPITQANIDEAGEFFAAHGEPFNRAGWDYILRVHAGYLPLMIKAVDEGSVVALGNVLASVVNTDPKCFWLTTYLETALLRAIWYPTTVATNSFMCKRSLLDALLVSSDDPFGQIDFKLHDFGARGVSSAESAALGGMAHLVNFKGSDTVEGILAARCYYDEPMAGFSIPAAEHSTITAWGPAGETDAYRNMLTQFAKPGSIVAVVSDSYDLMHAVNHIWGGSLKQTVIDSGATIVIRPDSGQPLDVPIAVVSALASHFGWSVNRKGYKVLPSCVRVIQGDGITRASLPLILDRLLGAGFAGDNLHFGMGGGLLQMVNRDDLHWAMKCAAMRTEDGCWHDVYKDPKTDPAKRSKRGRLALIQDHLGRHQTVPQGAVDPSRDLLRVRYLDGALKNQTNFAAIRARAAAAIRTMAQPQPQTQPRAA